MTFLVLEETLEAQPELEPSLDFDKRVFPCVEPGPNHLKSFNIHNQEQGSKIKRKVSTI